MIRKVIFTAMLLSSVFITGCSGTEQVHDKNYARAVAVSGAERVSAVFSFFGEDSELCKAAGDDLAQVKRNAELSTGKTLFTGHTEMIVLGEGCDYAQTLEYLFNEWKVSPSCIVVYGGGDRERALENNEAEELVDSVRRAIEQGKAPECDIVTVLGELLSEKGQARIACIDRNGFSGSIKIENK